MTQTLRYTDLPWGNCNYCGCRFRVGLSPFCSLRCERAHIDRQMGAGYCNRVASERAATQRREAYARRLAS